MADPLRIYNERVFELCKFNLDASRMVTLDGLRMVISMLVKIVWTATSKKKVMRLQFIGKVTILRNQKLSHGNSFIMKFADSPMCLFL
jgi:hypothetical protein